MHPFICAFVFPHDILKTNASRITKLYVDVVHHDTWKRVYFEIRGQGQSTKHVCVGLQKERNTEVCCWVFPASLPRDRCC